jgi:hypothetical protein
MLVAIVAESGAEPLCSEYIVHVASVRTLACRGPLVP